jgi:hypothetical protein
VPYEVALGLDEAERIAHVVIFGEFGGRRFDWLSLCWRN